MKHLFRLACIAILLPAIIMWPAAGFAEEKKKNPSGHDAVHGATDHKTHEPGKDKPVIQSGDLADSDLAAQVRVDEHLGSVVAMDAVFKDETGKEVRLDSFFDKPVVLLPIFFSCTAICGFLQADLAKALNQVDQTPGIDFNIITLSFSDDENESDAASAKKNYSNIIKREFPLEKWSYLTGTKENIKKLTGSLGFHFIKKAPHDYVHPSVLMVLSKDGRIIRYLYGPNFLPFDLGMALSEAQKGTPGISIKRGILSLCVNYDPAKKKYTFNFFRITGTAVLIALIGFVIFLLYPSKRNRKDIDTSVS